MLKFLEQKILNLSAKGKRPRIYILPTRVGLYFSVVVFILFLISFSYGHSLAYSSAFILISVLIISLPYTNYNINHINVSCVHGFHYYEDEAQELALILSNQSNRERFDIELDLTLKGDADHTFHARSTTLNKSERTNILVPLGALKMGHYQELIVKIKSSFPFGLFYSWSYRRLSVDAWVFPARDREGSGLQVTMVPFSKRGEDESRSNATDLSQKDEHDDFSKHNPFTPGHSFGSVDWKVFARTGVLYVKEFEGEIPQFERIYVPSHLYSVTQSARKLSYRISEATKNGSLLQIIAPDFEISSEVGHGAQFERTLLKAIVKKLVGSSS